MIQGSLVVFLFEQVPPCAVTFLWWRGLRTSMIRIAMLAGVFILLERPPKSDRLKDKAAAQSLSLIYFPIFLSFTFLLFCLIIHFSYLCAFLVHI